MAIRQSIREKIQSLAGVQTTCDSRVYWLEVREKAKLPCVLYSIQGGTWDNIDSCDADGPKQAIVEVWALSANPEEAIALHDELVSVDGLHGATWDIDGTAVVLSRVAQILPDEYADDPFTHYACGAEFEITYS